MLVGNKVVCRVEVTSVADVTSAVVSAFVVTSETVGVVYDDSAVAVVVDCTSTCVCNIDF